MSRIGGPAGHHRLPGMCVAAGAPLPGTASNLQETPPFTDQAGRYFQILNNSSTSSNEQISIFPGVFAGRILTEFRICHCLARHKSGTT
jgi:hypothetical protein